MHLVTPVRSGHVVIGVDTHKHLHVAAALDTIGGTLAHLTIPNERAGFADLAAWAADQGQIVAFGIEGTGSYGQALASYLRRQGARVVEVNRPDRRARRLNGKSDTIDAENAARSVLAGFATAEPKTADGAAEAIRRLKIAADTAVKARTAAMITLKTMLVHADEDLRSSCERLGHKTLCAKLSRLRPGEAVDPDTAARAALRSLARRWLDLDAEATALATQINALVQAAAPQLLVPFGIGPDTAAQILISVGDNPERIRSEAAFAKLAGVCPIPAGSGKTDGRHRLYRGGNRALNAALYRAVLTRMRRTTEGKTKKEIIRCLKRYLAREVFHLLKPAPTTPQPTT
jgi:transposase